MLIALIFIILACVFSALMSIALININRVYAGSNKGVLEWSLTSFCLFLMMLFYLLNSHRLGFFGTATSNVMGMLGTLFYFIGTRKHISANTLNPWWSALGIALVVYVSNAYFFFIEPSYIGRFTVNLLIAFPITVFHLHLIFKHLHAGLGKSFFILSVGLQFVFWLFRFLSLVVGWAHASVYESNPMYVVMAIVISIMVILVPLSCLLILSQHLRAVNNKKLSYDKLTHALLKNPAINAFNVEIGRSLRQNYFLSFIFIRVVHAEINHFSPVNLKQEKILIDFGNQMKKVLRESDVLGKVSSDDFVLMLPDTDSMGSMVVAERLRLLCLQQASLFHGVHIAVVELSETNNNIESILKAGIESLQYAQTKGIFTPLLATDLEHNSPLNQSQLQRP